MVGNDRFPDFDDLKQPPLIRAIVLGLLHWGPMLPVVVALDMFLFDANSREAQLK